MPQAKKFNAFSGVFTPSVLTILGVIMYMRLGWVVGEAGIWAALTIILVAHIISVSTGLSISSIATDKKIKTGGIYYVLSRSLGLPMGGSIGITLFIGTALSIALYLVGFAENFLGIDAIRDFLHLGQDINSIRLVGTVALLILVAIALISTSLAIKSQFVILGAIAVSLIAIALGFVFNSGGGASEIAFTPREGGVDLITVFAIFFPAVTGFTAGVAMSGDLKDPKKDIPKGTLWAIATGLVVYVTLAILFGVFVDRDMLVNDNNFIMKIAIWAPLVIAGIWGATLSSALGGILGGPRILQAVAIDRIVPSFLGKGTGASNEPRNALILTFVIAEAGILIGELNAIAAVVSMFYIAAYGFINLAYALESWASTDFRPSFKISRWIGIIGFIASFGVMFQLNPGAMFAAFFFMWAIYFILRRREVKLEYGDVWSSVWSSVMRSSLNRLDKQKLEDRNWQPNIILFSGGSKNRPHLVHFGKNLVGKHGFLSNFDLCKKDADAYTFTKQEQSIQEDQISDEYKGIFARRHSVNDIYDGIEQIASTYGFAGVEPNTVFLGWGRNSKEPTRFVHMLQNLEKLDQNLLMMDYDKERKFGDRKLIDIWWRGKGQNGNLSLQLVKFLWQSEDWEGARLRLIIVNPVNDEQGAIHKQAMEKLDNLRMDAEVKVINNQIEKKSFYEIVQTESIHTDLIFMGLPDVKEGDEVRFIERTNELCKHIGTVILIKASGSFKALNLGISETTKISDKPEEPTIVRKQERLHFENPFPHDSIRYQHVQNTFEFMMEAKYELQEKTLNVIFQHKQSLLTELKKHIQKGFMSLNYTIERKNDGSITSDISHIHNKFLKEFHTLIQKEWAEKTQLYKDLLEKFIKIKSSNIDRLVAAQPPRLKIYYTREELEAKVDDRWMTRSYKFFKRLRMRLGLSKGAYRVDNKSVFKQLILPKAYHLFEQINVELGAVLHQYIVELQKLGKQVDTIFLKIEIASRHSNIDAIDAYKAELLKTVGQLQSYYEDSLHALNTKLDNNYVTLIDTLSSVYADVAPNRLLDEEFQERKMERNFKASLKGLGNDWAENQNLLYNQLRLNVNLMDFQTHLRKHASLLKQQMSSYVKMRTVARQTKLLQYLKQYREDLKENSGTEFVFSENTEQQNFAQVDFVAEATSYLLKYTEEFPEFLEIHSEDGFNSLSNQPFIRETNIKISTAQLLDYLIQNEYIESIKSLVKETEEEMLRLNNRLNDHIRLISYSKYSEEEFQDPELDTQQYDSYIEREISRLEAELDESAALISLNEQVIEKQLSTTLDKISIVPFVNAAQDLKQYIRRQKDVRKDNAFSKARDFVWNIIKGRYAQLLYRQTRGIIITRRFLRDTEEVSVSDVNKLITSHNKLYIKPSVLEKVPFYYKQLFIRKHNYLHEFWVGRKKELAMAEQAFENFRNGFDGGILVHGERHSGKSFFANYAISSLLPSYKVLSIQAPMAGSTDPEVFKKMVEEACGHKGSWKSIFQHLPKNTVLLIEDLELWWERRKDGDKVIRLIKELVHTFGQQHLIMVTANSAGLKIIDSTLGFSEEFISKIEMLELDSEELKEMILYRHKTSALEFLIRGRAQKHFKEWHLAILFNQYYRFTKGNPGFALNTWINNIIGFEDDVLKMRRPLSRHFKEYQNLDAKTKLVLVTLILHNTVSTDKLTRVLHIDRLEAVQTLAKLKRSGIVKEIDKDVYKVSKMIHHLVYRHLKEQNQIA